MTASARFTREQVAQVDKHTLIDLVLLFQDHLDELSQRVKQLEDQVAKQSRNSSKPPSSNELSKPKTRSLRRAAGRRPGGQEGHPGQTLAMSEQPDHVEIHALPHCSHCASDLSAVAASEHVRRQVYEVPPGQIEVTEHRAAIKDCAQCQQKVQAAFPLGALSRL